LGILARDCCYSLARLPWTNRPALGLRGWGLLLFLATGLSAALQRRQQGLPVVAAPGAVAETLEKPVRRSFPISPNRFPPEFGLSKTEVDGFQAQDSTAAKAVVILMAGVFCVGVILYTVIAVNGFPIAKSQTAQKKPTSNELVGREWMDSWSRTLRLGL